MADPSSPDAPEPRTSETWDRDGYTISTDPDRIDRDAVHRFLAESYWAADRPPDVIDRSLDHSMTFGLYQGDRMVGMARVVSDLSTFAWLCDVYIESSHRGAGLGQWLIEVVSEHPSLRDVRRWLLGTSYSHSLYARFGYTAIPEPDRYMIRRVAR